MAKTLKSLAPGTTLVVPRSNHNGVPLILRKLADDHHATGTTLLDTRDIIDLIAFDDGEPTNSNKGREDGNNNYRVSNIRQYLNSVGPNWYEPQHYSDEPPYGYERRNGFLSAFPTEFVERIVTTNLTTTAPNIDGGSRYTLKDKVFLLSRTEVGLGNEGGNTEGEAISFFKDDTARRKKPTQQAISNTSYTDSNLTTTKPWRWWLRSPDRNTVGSVRHVNSDGTLFSKYAYSIQNGVAPALNLPSDTPVSNVPNAQGHYEIMLTPPIETPKIKIGTENKEILEMYLKVDGSNKAIVEAHISINGTNKPWI